MKAPIKLSQKWVSYITLIELLSIANGFREESSNNMISYRKTWTR